jgi:D-glycero-D-manno-heptose 1,7-bisphosphate phosphatase
MRPAIFLDRDGVITENIEGSYVNTIADVSFINGALGSLAELAKSNYAIVIVTNQAGVGKGYFSLEMARAINAYVRQTILNSGGRVDGLYLCPHTPEENCECRKPRPGMLLQAQRELNIDLSRSWMIGDALTDLQAGKAAGVKETMLVLTGRGTQQAQEHNLQGVANLTEAVREILNRDA